MWLLTVRFPKNSVIFCKITCGGFVRAMDVSANICDEEVVTNLSTVLQRLEVATNRLRETDRWVGRLPKLVAVSKTKPSFLIRCCYDKGHRMFGENYVQELEAKAQQLKDTCPDIEWHFIGRLQSNKIAKLAAINNLKCIQTVCSVKHCDILNKEMKKRNKKMTVFIEVNTSGEEEKSGVKPDEAADLAEYVQKNCSSLLLGGFMTIGSFEASVSEERNPDFDLLYDVRRRYCARSGSSPADFDLSMGMSHDFESAIYQGRQIIKQNALPNQGLHMPDRKVDHGITKEVAEI
ncbi:hypothetical protein AB6A40_007798 [Gnathostoma spinigerum]|uniref:Pyridoxal phosphate homeostasis protein n=1 Tax=Gnathostoma spinigerum TaxID=75299 RepID=A0ABD6EMB2_9BILA